MFFRQMQTFREFREPLRAVLKKGRGELAPSCWLRSRKLKISVNL